MYNTKKQDLNIYLKIRLHESWKFGASKDTMKKLKRLTTDLEKKLQIIYLIKDLYPEYIKTFKAKLKKKQLKNRQKIWIDISPGQTHACLISPWSSTLSVTREM